MGIALPIFRQKPSNLAFDVETYGMDPKETLFEYTVELPDQMIRGLSNRAQLHGLSMNEEILKILDESVRAELDAMRSNPIAKTSN